VSAAVLSLRQQRCVNHSQREASARCPECGRFFCRECITEHDDRVLCASCLVKIARREKPAGSRWSLVMRVALAVFSFAVVLIVLLMLGNFLLSIPSEFHDTGGF
jgi:late competence protein required for DNA uptake (superfamily II DNA/RNA helicase)